jgi:hypothetical protein
MVVTVGLNVTLPPVLAKAYFVLSKLSVITTLVAFAAVTVSVEDCPLAIVVGFAVMEAVGALDVTVTVACAVAVPPAPVTVMV